MEKFENFDNLTAMFDHYNEAVYIVDKKRQILYFNPMATQISGFTKAETEGSFCYDNILNHVNDEGIHLCKNHCPLVEAINEKKIIEHYVYLHHKNGHRVRVLVRVYPYVSYGEIVGAIEVFTNQTQATLSLDFYDENEKLTMIDPLTKLYNRRVIEKALLSHLAYHHIKTVGVLFIDFDKFKDVNDTYGHQFGDRVLVSLTQTILHNIRGNDVAVRYGGDEIVVFLLDIDEKDIIDVAEKFKILLEQTGPREQSFDQGASIGAVIKKDDETLFEAIHRADQAMYEAKKRGGKQVIYR